MARGNQRDQDRAKKLRDEAKKKDKNNQTGTQMQHAKESNAEIMRRKQAASEARRAAEAAKK
ncbi:hypothetical protein ACHAPO_005211 [Fusarium lateritium]